MVRRMNLDLDQVRMLELINEGRKLQYIAGDLGQKHVQNVYERVRVLEKHGYVVRRGKKRWCVRWLSEKGIGVLEGCRLNLSYVRCPKKLTDTIVGKLAERDAKMYVMNTFENMNKREVEAKSILGLPATERRRCLEALDRDLEKDSRTLLSEKLNDSIKKGMDSLGTLVLNGIQQNAGNSHISLAIPDDLARAKHMSDGYQIVFYDAGPNKILIEVIQNQDSYIR